ncbi:hypothetical protein ACQ4PT_021284 [Festuca glaucescens]
MAPPPTSNLPPLVAAATEYRLSTGRVKILRDPATGEHSSVRFHGDLVLNYLARQVGGHRRMVHKNLPVAFDKTFVLTDPGSFHESYVTCSAKIHQMLQQIPVLMDFDLDDRHWDLMFLPHSIAMVLVGNFQQAIERNTGVDSVCAIDVDMSVVVTGIYNEHRALLLACQQAMATPRTPVKNARCSVCLEDIGPADEILSLPCQHSSHPKCMLGWFRTSSRCPDCREDAISVLSAATGTASGRFPGLEA